MKESEPDRITMTKLFSLFLGTGIGKVPGVNSLFTYLVSASDKGIYTRVDGLKLMAVVYQYPRRHVLFHTDEHEPNVQAIFRSLIKKGMVVVDVGAALGLYTLLAAKRVGNQGVVYSFEPDPVRYMGLRKSIQINGFGGVVKTFPCAVADGDVVFVGMRDLDYAATTDGNHQLKAITLDSIIDDADVVKIDVVGNEFGVLRGMWRILLKGEVKIICEVYPENLVQIGYSVNEIATFMRGFDYSPSIIEKDGVVRRVEALLPRRAHYLFTKEGD